MKLATRYLLYILALHTVLVGLVWQVLKTNKPIFIASEGVLVVSVLVAWGIYRTFRQPAEFIRSGIEAIRDQDFTIKFVPTGNAEVDELIRVYNLMIDQLRLERTRQAEQQHFLDKLIEAAPIALLILDFDGRISTVNPKAEQLLGLSAAVLLNKPIDATGHRLLDKLANQPTDKPLTIRGQGAETYQVLPGQFVDRGFRRRFLFIDDRTADIAETEKKAYGKVIRMMAHEVNNSIGAVNSIVAIAEREQPDDDLRQALRVAIDRNDRLNQFMHRFADVVRLPTPHLVPTDLAALVQNVARLMQPQAAARAIALRPTLPEKTVVWPIDVTQIEQVLVNVVKNALDACRAGHAIELLLTPRQLQIRNNGPAIPEAVAAQLFNPFFSTKPDGQGIGLTLSRDILLNHGLTFSLQSQMDGWTVFTISYPA